MQGKDKVQSWKHGENGGVGNKKKKKKKKKVLQ